MLAGWSNPVLRQPEPGLTLCELWTGLPESAALGRPDTGIDTGVIRRQTDSHSTLVSTLSAWTRSKLRPWKGFARLLRATAIPWEEVGPMIAVRNVGIAAAEYDQQLHAAMAVVDNTA